MISAELYRQGRPTVIVERTDDTNAGSWARLQEALARGIISGARSRTVVHAEVFLAELDVLREIRNVFRERISIGPALKEQLQAMAAERTSRQEAIASHCPSFDPDKLDEELKKAGFARTLKEFQRENVSRLLTLPHGADFSVPGAGKTTVALAAFALRRHRGEINRLLVVAPLAAFSAWKDDTIECFQDPPALHVYQGTDTRIPPNTEVLLVNYHRVANDFEVISKYVAQGPCGIVLDEAHRIKRGADGVHGRAVLDLAYTAARRDVLTGTPAPQGANDLVALVRFLYPGQDRQILPHDAYNPRLGREPSVLSETQAAIAPYFVRTPKSRLKLPRTNFTVVRREMPPIQSAIYDALVGRYRSMFSLTDDKRHEMRRLGRVVMYLLEAATNPMLITAGSDENDDPGFTHPPIEIQGDEPLRELLDRYGSFEFPWKYREVISIVQAAAERGEKILVWSSFVRNIRLLSKVLDEFSPATIHGGVPSLEDPAPGIVTREMELDRFRNDPRCSVLLANPSACGEGISLHHWCHTAVYLDRTFNAGHFLQSQDRIHRLGLEDNVLTNFIILASIGSIDETVDGRLEDKVRALSKLMDDPGLVDIALPASDEGKDGDAVFDDDTSAVLTHLDASR